MAAVAADHEIGADFELLARRPGAHADDAPALFDQRGRFRAHAQIETLLVAAALVGKEIEEVPLRHEGDELAVGRDVAQVAQA